MGGGGEGRGGGQRKDWEREIDGGRVVEIEIVCVRMKESEGRDIASSVMQIRLCTSVMFSCITL